MPWAANGLMVAAHQAKRLKKKAPKVPQAVCISIGIFRGCTITDKGRIVKSCLSKQCPIKGGLKLCTKGGG
jgi:hypothetical protein